jgi:superfamily II DNA or RNA helicase
MKNKIILRKYQEQILDTLFDKLKHKDKAIITLGMGGGKSLIISKIAEHYNKDKKIIILTNVSMLINQLKEHLDMLNLDYSIIKSNETVISDKSNIYLIMEQSFHESSRSLHSIDCDILIKDEFHIGYSGKRYKNIIESVSPKKIIGLTGTPITEQGYILDGFSKDDLITFGSTKDLTDQGFLVPLKYFTPKWSLDIDYSSVKKTGIDYSTTELDKIINTYSHNDLIMKSMIDLDARNKKTLVYCNSIEHCDSLTALLKSNGFLVDSIHSKKNHIDNENILSNFKKTMHSSIDCIVSVSKLTTGFNEPHSQLLVLCRPTKILRLYLQILFRVARLHPSKKFGEILDLAQCVPEHGFGTQQIDFTSSRKDPSKKKNMLKEFKLLVRNLKPPYSIDFNDLKLIMKEVKVKNLKISESSEKDLISLFNTSSDITSIFYLFFELNSRINKIRYSISDVENTISSCTLSSISDIVSLKQDLKNKIKENTF